MSYDIYIYIHIIIRIYIYMHLLRELFEVGNSEPPSCTLQRSAQTEATSAGPARGQDVRMLLRAGGQGCFVVKKGGGGRHPPANQTILDAFR
jgi:hypothetical protein